MNHLEYFFCSYEGEPARLLTISEGLGENEWNVYVEEWNEETHDYEEVDVGLFPTFNEAYKSIEERCDVLEVQGFVLKRMVVSEWARNALAS